MEETRSGASLTLFGVDAANGMDELFIGATLTSSPARTGWTRFSATVDAVAGQPFFAITFQNVNGNGVPADSAFLVDNFDVSAVPEPAAAVLILGALFAGLVLRRRTCIGSALAIAEPDSGPEARQRLAGGAKPRSLYTNHGSASPGPQALVTW